MPRRIDMTDRRYGRLTVVKPSLVDPEKWVCQCDCGKAKEINGCSLRRGLTQSCGCLHVEAMKARGTHHKSKTKIYRLWSMMLDRCNNQKNKYYPRYGKRGIKVCERWETFDNFYADMGERPNGKSLDRIDNDQGYTPDNCRWASPREQNINKADNRRLTYQGKTQTLLEWSEELGINYNTLNTRVQRGWPDERVLGQPIKPVSVAWRNAS